MDEDLLHRDRWFRDKGVKSLLIIPLIAKGEPIGVLNIGSLQRNRFGPRDIEVAEQYALQIAVALDNANLYEEMRSLFMDTVTSLSAAMDAKSPWTRNHSAGASTYALTIAREMGLDEAFVSELKLSVLLHDIGKIGIENTILNKPSRLSDEEIRIVRDHPLKGASILDPIKELKGILPIVRHHHEWWDGTGYPHGLSGNMIPLGARILCVADAFDAMITERPYRKGLTLEDAKQELIRFSGAQFDPMVVDAFIAVCIREENLEKRQA
ncbi:MAG: HD domain-containing protein [Deltaproteobacteria bacterium]|nr:HD domain-containing protein [Deltaproteobacteria bacterium]